MKGYRKGLVVIVILALGAIFWGFMLWRQPRYEGKTAAQWFNEFRQARLGSFQNEPGLRRSIRLAEFMPSPGDKALEGLMVPAPNVRIVSDPPKSISNGKDIEALRALGTTAAPFLAKQVYSNNTRALYFKYYPQIPNFLKSGLPLPYDENINQYAAIRALIELGSAAAPVIPDLVQILIDSRVSPASEPSLIQLLADADLPSEQLDRLIDELMRRQCYAAASRIITRSKFKTPSMILALTRITQADRSDSGAWWCLEAMGAKAEAAVPILRTNLLSPDGDLRYRSIRVLGTIGTNAAPALDTIRLLSLQDTNTMVRSAALRALPLIAPDWNKTNSAVGTGAEK